MKLAEGGHVFSGAVGFPAQEKELNLTRRNQREMPDRSPANRQTIIGLL